jgi:hypothetical protein
VGWSSPIRRKIVILVIVLAAAGAVFNVWRSRRESRAPEAAYILADSAPVMDSPAQVRLEVASLRHGERVEVLERTRNWARVSISDGRRGWIELVRLIDARSYEKGQQLLRDLTHAPVQAVGHTAGLANLRAEPARDAPQLAQLPANQTVEVFGRRLVDRPPQPGAPAASEPPRDAWYLVRADTKAGWVLGRLITLDIPEAISHYAQTTNLVAWLTLNTVEDNGRAMPQYLAADRVGTPEHDFTHIRVFTWWSARQQYATAYVESNLKGYFPIRVIQVDGAPHFRLRLVDRSGRKVQKVYRMVDTIVRPVGTVDGWESNAMPDRRAGMPRPGGR